MATNADESGPAGNAATITDLRVAVGLVGRGIAGSVTIVGVSDAEAAAAAVAPSAPGVSIEVVRAVEPASPSSTIRVRRAGARLPVVAERRADRRPPFFVRRPAAI